MFQYFLSDDIKKYSDTTIAHRKDFIALLKEQKLIMSSLSTIWENIDGCAEQYICATALYLMSVILKFDSIRIYHGISAPLHVKEVVYGINSTDKCYKY